MMVMLEVGHLGNRSNRVSVGAVTGGHAFDFFKGISHRYEGPENYQHVRSHDFDLIWF